MMGHIDMFFPLYTAAQLGHPRARSQLAVLFFETGLKVVLLNKVKTN